MKSIGQILRTRIEEADASSEVLAIWDARSSSIVRYTAFTLSAKLRRLHNAIGLSDASSALLVACDDLEAYVCCIFYALISGRLLVPLKMPASAESLEKFVEAMRLIDSGAVCLSERTANSFVQSAIEAARTKGLAIFDAAVVRETSPKGGECLWSSEFDLSSRGTRPAILQMTSGSTGRPKGVCLTNKSIMANLAAIQETFEISQESRIVSWLPLHHDMGLVGGFLQPLFSSASVLLFRPSDFIKSPVLWLRLLSNYQATVSGGPSFAFRHIASNTQKSDLSGIDLRTWRVCFCGSEPIIYDDLMQFADLVEPCGFDRKAFVACYGLAEATLMVSGSKVGSGLQRELWRGRKVISCGNPVRGMKVKIVSPKTNQVCRNGNVGEVCISGDSVAAGYFGPHRAVAFPKEARWSDGSHTFYRTKDLGILRRSTLFVLGRRDDMIKIRGRLLFAGEIERIICSVFSSRARIEAVVFKDCVGRSEGVGVILQTRLLEKVEQEVEAIHEELALRLGIIATRIWIFRRKIIAYTTSGKKKRFKAAVTAGALRPYWSREDRARPVASANAEADRPDAETLAPLVSSIIGRLVNPGDMVYSAYALGCDSLQILELQSQIDQHFNIETDYADYYQRPLLDVILNSASKRTAASAASRAHTGSSEWRVASEIQQELWVAAARNNSFNKSNVFDLYVTDLAMSLDRMKAFLSAMRRRHDVFRHTFALLDGRLHYRDMPKAPVKVAELQCGRPFAAESESNNLKTLVYQDHFTFQDGCNAKLIRLSYSNNVRAYIFLTHHLVMDRWSSDIVKRAMGRWFRGEDLALGEKQGDSYAAYVDYINEKRRRPAARSAADRIRSFLLEGGVDEPENIAGHGLARDSAIVLNKHDLTTAAERAAVSSSHMLILLLSYHMHHLFKKDVVPICLKVSGRTSARFRNTVGLMANSVPFVSTLSRAKPRFADYTKEMDPRLRDIHQLVDVPHTDIAKWIGIEGFSLSRLRISLNHYKLAPIQMQSSVSGVPSKLSLSNSRYLHRDVAVEVAESATNYRVVVSYLPDKIDDSRIMRFCADVESFDNLMLADKRPLLQKEGQPAMITHRQRKKP
jgi:acyl-CoA synthetase (AMP-forming)/AMP-acid ligase II